MSNSPFPKTIATVNSLGLDSSLILVDGIDINGYDILVPDAQGRKQYGMDGEVIYERRSWPSYEDGLKVLNVFLRERVEEKR